ncbi:hypothetical protein HDU92_005983 [Lobulomyces angularis]|nr:hypothetical protein HDU92_005983 [Lobulomyces angularis]
MKIQKIKKKLTLDNATFPELYMKINPNANFELKVIQKVLNYLQANVDLIGVVVKPQVDNNVSLNETIYYNLTQRLLKSTSSRDFYATRPNKELTNLKYFNDKYSIAKSNKELKSRDNILKLITIIFF